MNYSKSFIFRSLLLFMTLHLTGNSLHAQTEVIDAIEYRQISTFETDYSISSMKMSADGTRIVFATSGQAVKVFTINIDGSGLVQVYDYQMTGSGPSVDISADGEKVIWCDGFGEIFIANADGSIREELATLLPNPDTTRADLEPEIPLPPRITPDAGQVYFIHMDRDPIASGVWRTNTDGSGLTQVFNYIKMSKQVFGRDGSEYNYNTAFTDGFDISGDGSRLIFGTRIFKLEEGDIDRGEAIVADGTEFYKLGDYATGNQPFATYIDGDNFTMFRREYNDSLGYDEINVYFVPLGTGDPVKVISGLDIFATSRMVQMPTDGSRAIVMGGNGRLPITLVNEVSASRLDLVSIDGISHAIGGFNFSESALPSINWNGNKFCFLTYSNPPQIWVANIKPDGIHSHPSISEVQFEPDFVRADGSTTSTFKAHVTSAPDTIHAVTFETFIDGALQFRGLQADRWPFHPRLVDDGTLGDTKAGDGFFYNNSVRIDLPETPAGSYTVRVAAVNSTLKEVTMVDAEPFSIVEQSTSVAEPAVVPAGFSLHQNYPNPFNQTTRIGYSIPEESYVDLKVYDILGNETNSLVSELQPAGNWTISFDAEHLSSGIYYYRIKAGDFIELKQMLLIR